MPETMEPVRKKPLGLRVPADLVARLDVWRFTHPDVVQGVRAASSRDELVTEALELFLRQNSNSSNTSNLSD